ncbi:MAG: type I glyceraldehyde-3-phosphate dehydrogenase [bacterium]|nr:type I glyceraldehyde-3-phosphate dehydrogenase [bacterium]
MKMRVGINGFGRIGRAVLRAGSEREGMELVAVNDLTEAKVSAHLLKYDSVHGTWTGSVEAGENSLVVNGKEIKVLAFRDPKELPWKDLGVDVVVESTGLFTKKEQAEVHLETGAKKVIISAPAKGDVATIVMGVNEESYNPATQHILSNASCTTNCLAPLAKVLLSNFGIERGFMTTIHSYTNDQRILDLPHKDLRRARAAALSMIPTTTGAAKAMSLVIPCLAGKLDGFSMRVPTPNVSVVDFVVISQKEATKDEVNNAFKKASLEGPLAKYLEYCSQPLVSSDFNGNPASSIFDSALTMTNGNLIKVIGWYDNEWGYSCRVIDLIEYISKK